GGSQRPADRPRTGCRRGGRGSVRGPTAGPFAGSAAALARTRWRPSRTDLRRRCVHRRRPARTARGRGHVGTGLHGVHLWRTTVATCCTGARPWIGAPGSRHYGEVVTSFGESFG